MNVKVMDIFPNVRSEDFPILPTQYHKNSKDEKQSTEYTSYVIGTDPDNVNKHSHNFLRKPKTYVLPEKHSMSVKEAFKYHTRIEKYLIYI